VWQRSVAAVVAGEVVADGVVVAGARVVVGAAAVVAAAVVPTAGALLSEPQAASTIIAVASHASRTAVV
jgi:hypothetical protein